MTVFSWIFGFMVMGIGLVNTFWGNDPGLGVFLVALSFLYFPPANAFTREKFGFAIPILVKIILDVLIIWVSLGVGELFDKIGLMMEDL